MNRLPHPSFLLRLPLLLVAALSLARATTLPSASFAGDPAGPGAGKRIVFLTGDEEYGSEESMPMLAGILAARHGFDCTVLFSINPETGAIDPGRRG